jgi:hypothetical protein
MMAVLKFRSIEDTPEAPWRAPGDPGIAPAFSRLWRMSRELRPRRFPPGVYRHRSIVDMNAQKSRWDAEHVAAVAAVHSTTGKR